jgi:hypothetical protein
VTNAPPCTCTGDEEAGRTLPSLNNKQPTGIKARSKKRGAFAALAFNWLLWLLPHSLSDDPHAGVDAS